MSGNGTSQEMIELKTIFCDAADVSFRAMVAAKHSMFCWIGNAGKRAFRPSIEAHRISSDTELTPGEAKSY
jgi:hypothetical protein